MESLNKCIDDLQNERRYKIRHHEKYKTNWLNLGENQLDCKRN